VTEDHLDGEAEILRRVRSVIGDLPLAVSLDLHANLSAEVVELADAIAIYRTYPHLDMAETGARAWALLGGMIATGKRPAKAFRQVPHLIPLSAQCTDFGPLEAFYDALASHRVMTADAALGFPLSDTPVTGPSVVAFASDQTEADRCADRLAGLLSDAAAGVYNTLLAPAKAVAHAADLTADGGTVVLADVQDNSGAGAMADSTGLLAALVESGVGRCLLGTLWDPKAVASAHRAGVGAVLHLALGGRSGPAGIVPFECYAEVIALSDGRFICTGRMQRGVETDIGRSALLRIAQSGGDVTVLLSSLRHQTIDAAAFRHIGADPSDYRIVGIKSTVHFRADFAPLAKTVLMVDAPGYSTCRLEILTYKRLGPRTIASASKTRVDGAF
ncbi:MAG: MlrC C-terminal domain-containing protein, partial [Pseudomonadota bacterium]